MSLYSLMDWARFRETLDLKSTLPALQTFYESAAVQPAVAATDPRQ